MCSDAADEVSSREGNFTFILTTKLKIAKNRDRKNVIRRYVRKDYIDKKLKAFSEHCVEGHDLSSVM